MSEESTTVSIQCFGIFRQFGDRLSINVDPEPSILQVKHAITLQLGKEHKALVEESVLANDDEILSNAYVLSKETSLSILPPVCGG